MMAALGGDLRKVAELQMKILHIDKEIFLLGFDLNDESSHLVSKYFRSVLCAYPLLLLDPLCHSQQFQ